MIEGVRNESKCKMIFFYLSSLALCVFHIYVFIEFLVNIKFLKVMGGSIGMKVTYIICMVIVPFLLTVITIINSIICHRNFGKGLKIYLNYDPRTFKELIRYTDDLDQCYKDDD
ncbi:hypothetical protein RhiirC2_771725 [Rhizophagus irregularis]|uniref:Uncharacterized protein n=1 Tax=Rhizophagus irregularis TaxID=588596 RepID=A0A2N1NT99_9GLOM|nr:hypothetical protein RhiirC2_771725 [Rhizophagus irregularis]